AESRGRRERRLDSSGDRLGMSRFDDDCLDELATEGDPIADAVVAEHARERIQFEPRELVADIGTHLVLPPERRSPAISAYLDAQPPLPGWADPDRLAAGSAFFANWGLEISTGLLCASLPESYAGARGAHVLCLTTRLVSDPVRRVSETARFLCDVTVPQ